MNTATDSAARAGRPSPGEQRLAFAGLALFTLLLYARPQELYPEVFGDFPLAKIVAIGTLAVYFVTRLARGEPLTIWPTELRMLAIIALLGVLFMPIAEAPGDSWATLTDVFLKVVAIFVLLINLVRTPARLRLILQLVLACSVFIALSAIHSYVTGQFSVRVLDVSARVGGLVGGIFGNPNDLATSLVMLAPLAVALAITSRGASRALYAAAAVVLVAGTVVTFSRGGFLALVAASGVLLWKLTRHNRGLTLAGFVLFLALFVVATPSGYSTRITSIFDNALDPVGSAQARRDLLERAWNVAIRRPVIGVGMGNYHIYSLREQVAHNSYLEIAAELGLAGLIAYIVLLVTSFKSMRRLERQTAGAGGGPPDDPEARQVYYLSIALQATFTAYLVASFFSSIQYHWYLYYPVAYAIALRNMYARASEPAAEGRPAGSPQKGVLWRARAAAAR